MIIDMSLEEFKKIAKNNPEGFMFTLICKKCLGTRVALEINGEAIGGESCDTCGYGSEPLLELGVLIKCKTCGNVFNYKKGDGLYDGFKLDNV